MKIVVATNSIYYRNKPVETYARSMVRALRFRGHEVVEVPKKPPETHDIYKGADLLLDIDCGRDARGELHWHVENGRVPIPSAVYFIDSHGYPSEHKRLALGYDHVFFAVWSRRDLFAKHRSAHWCPNFTDLKWFDGINYPGGSYSADFGFFGSKGGLDRAQPLVEIANNHQWVPDVRQLGINTKHRWPATADAMANCEILFNHCQKHDGPNLRVMESMLMLRPLICDRDPQGGMEKLFEGGTHFIPYEAYTYHGLEAAMVWAKEYPDLAGQIAANAYQEVKTKHLVENRIDQILEHTR